MQNGLELAKDVSFLNLIAESGVFNVVLRMNVHQQSSTYVISIEWCIDFDVCFHRLNFVHFRLTPNKLLFN